MLAFSPINENVFTTEAWILLGPPVHKLYGWLPLITVLLETCAWSGLIGACLAPERAPMCFAWIVGKQQGFRLSGNSIVAFHTCGLRDEDVHHWKECFLCACLILYGDFPGGPVIKTLSFNEWGASSIPVWGAKIPHACGQKDKI